MKLEILLGNLLSGDFHGRSPRGEVLSAAFHEDEADEEENQHDDHEAGVFADVFDHDKKLKG